MSRAVGKFQSFTVPTAMKSPELWDKKKNKGVENLPSIQSLRAPDSKEEAE